MEHSVEANGPEVEIKSSQLSSLLVVYSQLMVASRRKKVFSPKYIKYEYCGRPWRTKKEDGVPVFKEFTIE